MDGRQFTFGSGHYRFHYHRLRRELGNYSLLRLRRCAGGLVSMHQSGTHWLKFMLASAMSDHYGISPPRYNHANDIIGGPHDTHKNTAIPHLISSHTIPPLLLNNAPGLSWVGLPPCIVLVRDVRASLVSNYKKWRTRYGVSFSEFLRGDPSGHRFNSDIWWCFRFMNAWGRAATLAGGRIQIVHYESLLAAPQRELQRVVIHLGLPLSEKNVEHGVQAANKSAMVARSDPGRPPGEINLDVADPKAAFSVADQEYFTACAERYLKQTFGYDYASWN